MDQFIFPDISMDQELYQNMLRATSIESIIESWNPKPAWYRFGHTWESIEVPEGFEKPPQEEFDTKLQELMDAAPLNELRTKRNALLERTDRYATPDYPHSNLEVQQSWFDYRQTLRDLPSTTEDPKNPTWPTPPQ
jgi:hypothetical protein